MTEPMRILRETLTEIDTMVRRLPRADGYVYGSTYEFVLRHGEEFEAIALPEEYEYAPPKLCFANAIMMAEEHGLDYVEGYAMADALELPLPVHHAWNTDAEGRLIDVTWGAILLGSPERQALPNGAYLGIRFSVDRADDATWNGDGSVLDDWKRGWPLFKSEWKGEDPDAEYPTSPLLKALRSDDPRAQAAAVLAIHSIGEEEDDEEDDE